MAWCGDWQQRRDRMFSEGLPLRILDFRIQADEWGFIAMYVEIDENLLPRTHEARGFELHFSMGYLKELVDSGHPASSIHDMVVLLNARYAGSLHIMNVEWMGKGGTAYFHLDDPLLLDPIVDFIFNHAGLAWKGAHISL
jgi:hypothetical protein